MELSTTTLEQIAEITMGQSPDSMYLNHSEVGLPFLQGCAEFGRQHPVPTTFCDPPLRVAQAHSILVSVRAPVGTLNWADQRYCIGRGLAAIKGRANIADTGFISFVLQNDSTFLHRRSQGSTFLAIGGQDLAKFPVPSFSFQHQQKIAYILQTIDQAIEKTEQLIEKYQQIKAGLMHDLFTRGIGADGKLRPTREQAPELYQETPIGWIPKEWDCDFLDHLAVRGSGHTPSKSHPEYWNGGIKWISLADSSRLDKLYISDTQYEISNLGMQNSSAVLHPAGIVVLSRDAGVGKSAVTTIPMAVSQHFMCWRCDEERLHNIFLYYWLQHNKRFFENIAMGSTILTIGLSYFKKLKIGHPVAISEQRKIASTLLTSEEKLVSLRTELSKYKQIKSGLMHDLLTGKVPVSVDPIKAPLSLEQGAA